MMKMFKPLLLTSVALIGFLTITGCSANTSSIPFHKVEDHPIGQSELQPVWEVVNKDTVRVNLFGSSTCKPTIVDVNQDKDGTLNVVLKDYGSRPCTADYGGPFTWEINNITKQVSKLQLITTGSSRSSYVVPEV